MTNEHPRPAVEATLTAGAPPAPPASRDALPRPARVARLVRRAVDVASVALALYALTSGYGAFLSALLFWALSSNLFPYRKPPERYLRQREMFWAWLLGGGVLLTMSVYLWSEQHNMARMVLLGSAMTMGGIASLPSKREPPFEAGPSLRRLLFGLVSLALMLVWVVWDLWAKAGK